MNNLANNAKSISQILTRITNTTHFDVMIPKAKISECTLIHSTYFVSRNSSTKCTRVLATRCESVGPEYTPKYSLFLVRFIISVGGSYRSHLLSQFQLPNIRDDMTAKQGCQMMKKGIGCNNLGRIHETHKDSIDRKQSDHEQHYTVNESFYFTHSLRLHGKLTSVLR